MTPTTTLQPPEKPAEAERSPSRPRGARVGAMARCALSAAVFLFLLAGWEVAGRNDTTGLLPPFSDVAAEVVAILTDERLTTDVLPSVLRALLGFALGSLVGVTVGVALGWWRSLDPWLRPPLEFLRAVPPPALVPIVVVAFGASNTLRVAVIALGACWPVLLNTTDGLRRVEAGYIDSARVYTSGRATAVLRRAALPAALPQITSGLRIGLALSLILMVISEMIASSSGLGYLILQSQRLYALTPMYAGVLILAFTGWLLTLLFSAAERRALVWFEGMKGHHHA